MRKADLKPANTVSVKRGGKTEHHSWVAAAVGWVWPGIARERRAQKIVGLFVTKKEQENFGGFSKVGKPIDSELLWET